MADLDPIEEFERSYEWSGSLYRSIGRFIVQFEWLCDGLRQAICELVWDDPGSHPTLVRIVLGEAQPGALLIRFQSILAHISGIDHVDRPIIDDVCKRIDRLIQERNSVVHGLWFTELQLPDRSAIASKIKYTPKGLKGVNWKRTPEEIEQLADEAAVVNRLVGHIRSAQSSGVPLSGWLIWDDDGAVRFPPGLDG